MFSKCTLIGAQVATGFWCFLLFSVGCSTPGERFHEDASTRGYQAHESGSNERPIAVFRKGVPAPGAPLHIYLDGDGSPEKPGARAASDPASRDRLILDFMDVDPAASVLIGRPCYYHQPLNCDPAWWTSHRYSDAVVESMAATINEIIANHERSTIRLIGYSGGGALAMLIAPRLERIDVVITVAANLDVAAWAKHHGRAPLQDSLDPAAMPALSPEIRQAHFFGADDRNVPPQLMRHVAERQAKANFIVVPGFTHRCCWVRDWQALLSRALTPPVVP